MLKLVMWLVCGRLPAVMVFEPALLAPLRYANRWALTLTCQPQLGLEKGVDDTLTTRFMLVAELCFPWIACR